MNHQLMTKSKECFNTHLWLQVTVDDPTRVHKAQSRHQLTADLTGLCLSEVALFADALEQLSSLEQLKDNVRMQLEGNKTNH